MKVIVFGASGRVGRAFVAKALDAGCEVTAFARNSSKVPARVAVVRGDARDLQSVKIALGKGFDAVVVCIGEGALRPSTIVTDAITTIAAAMTDLGQKRFLAVSGSAEMGRMTWGGRLTIAILRRTPVGHAIRDHDGGLSALKQSNLEWTLAACNRLADGSERGHYKTSLVFPGGPKVIHPGDVADFLLREMMAPHNIREVVGLWY